MVGVALTAPVGRGSVRAGASRLAAVCNDDPYEFLGSCDDFTPDERASVSFWGVTLQTRRCGKPRLGRSLTLPRRRTRISISCNRQIAIKLGPLF